MRERRSAMPGAGAVPPPSTIEQAIEAAKNAKACSESGADWGRAKDLSIEAAQLFLRAASECTIAARRDKYKDMAKEFLAAAERAKQKASEQDLAGLFDLPPVPTGTLGTTPPVDGTLPAEPTTPAPEPEAEPEQEPEVERAPEPTQLEVLVMLSWQPGLQLPMQVMSSSSVPELMVALCSLVGSPPNPAKSDILLFNTQPLQQRHCSVSDCGLTNGSVLFLVGDERASPAHLTATPTTHIAALGMPPAVPAPELPLWKLFHRVPQKPRNQHVLEVDPSLSSRWLRLRAPAGAATFHAEFTVRSLKGRQWRLGVFREPPGGGAGALVGEYAGDGSGQPEPHYCSTTQNREAIRLQVCSVEPRSGEKLEVCYKLLAIGPSHPASRPAVAGPGAHDASRQAQAEIEQLQQQIQEKGQTVDYLRREGIPADKLESELAVAKAQLTALQTDAQGPGAILDYPAASFDYLEQLRDQLAAPKKFPTAWADIPPRHGIIAPFTTELATAMSVKRRFKSKAKPFWVQFRVASGAVVDCVMKSGDDLRQVTYSSQLRPFISAHLCSIRPCLLSRIVSTGPGSARNARML